jgi:hypothetical protein
VNEAMNLFQDIDLSEEGQQHKADQKFKTLEYEEFFLIKGCTKPSLTQNGNLKLKNSMNLECELEFIGEEQMIKWRDLIQNSANEIDKELGKQHLTL